MILAIDIGNTNIKVGAWDNNRLAFVSRLQTNPLTTSDEYAVTINNLFRLANVNSRQFDGAIISSVVPQLTNSLADAVSRVIQVPEVLIISPGLKTGLNIKIDDPATLGSDMVCAGVAAIHQYDTPCLILSLGTATAIFAINENAEFLGGTVSPGITISLNALSSGAAQLPHISLKDPKHVIGTNTIDSMTAGVVYGHAAMIDGLVARFRQELGADNELTIVASGGSAEYIIPHCQDDIVINDNIVLEGLRLIYDKNVSY